MNPQFYISGPYHLNPTGYFFITHTFEYTSIVFFTLIIFLVINFKSILGYFSKIKKWTWITLFLIFLVGFWLRNSEYRYGSGVDGYFYQETAKTLYEKNLFAKGCALGNLDFCRIYHQHLFLSGYPYLITLLFYIFGQYDILAMIISGILSSLTIILIFSIGYLLFSDERVGLYAALISAFFPMDIMISSTATARPTSNFFICLTILFYIIGLKKDSIKFWSLFVATFSYAIHVRQENLILLIPIVLSIFLFGYLNKNQFKNLKKIKLTLKNSFIKFTIPIIVFLILSLPALHWILFGDVHYGGSMPDFSFQYFRMKAPAIISNLFTPEIFTNSYLFNPLTSIFFIYSIQFLFLKEKNRGKILFLWLIFLFYFIVYSSFFDIELSSDYVRTIQPLVIPYSLLSGFSLSKLEKKVNINKNLLLTIFFILLLLFLILESIRNNHEGFSFGVKLRPSLFKDGRLDEDYTGDIIQAINKTPSHSLIFVSQATVPDFDLVRAKERRWIDIDMIFYNFTVAQQEIEIAIHENIPIIFIEDYRCKYEKDEQCKFIYNNFYLVLLHEVNEIRIYDLKPTERKWIIN